MNSWIARIVVTGISLTLFACGGGGGGTGMTDGGGTTDGTADEGAANGVAVNAPGAGMDLWAAPANMDISTPATAWQVGTVTMDFPYVQGQVGASGNGFHVFTAGPGITSLSTTITGVENVDRIHMHVVTNGMVGAVVQPTMIGTLPATSINVTWTLTPGTVYLLEVHTAAGTLF